MRTALIGLVALVGSGPTLAQETAGDAEAGRQVAQMCQRCHGLDGDTGSSTTPHIGGQPMAYLAAQLRAYRSGERQHDRMSGVAKYLTDEQIDDVAAWYASHTATSVLPEGYDAAAAPILCVGCHGADGIAPSEGYPHLAGNDHSYIETQLKAYRSGEREHAMMTPIAQRLSEEDVAEVAEWFSSIGLELSAP